MNLVLKKTNTGFHSLLDDLFGSSIPFSSSFQHSSTPAVNIFETDTAFELSVAAPGKSRKDFNVEIDNNLLIVSSQSPNDDINNINHFTCREFNLENFERSFKLPLTVNTSKVNAKYNNGILLVYLPKLKDSILKTKKQIEIK